MKKLTLKNKLMTAAAAVLSLALLAGCTSAADNTSAGAAASGTQTSAMGTLLLSVNPEIEIDYDSRGQVVDLQGVNDDGKAVVSGYAGYEGQDCRTVVSGLVDEIYEGGYFDEKIDGHTKNIVVMLEEGSKYPGDDFLEQVADSVRESVKANQLDASTMTVDQGDLESNGYIGLEKAKELALSQLGLSADEATFVEREYELDDGVYEMEIHVGNAEYEVEVDARTGKITEADYDRNDDWSHYSNNTAKPTATPKPSSKPSTGGTTDYDDTDYGPNNDGVTDYDDTDYGPNNDGVTDYNDTNYDDNGTTNYTDYNKKPAATKKPAAAPKPNTNYGDTHYGNDTNYDDHGTTDYDNDGTDYGDTHYGNDTNYDDHGDTDYDDDDD